MLKPSANKNQLLERIRRGKITKTEAARKLGVARKTIYAWLEEYKKVNTELQVKQPTFNKLPKKLLERAILQIIVANPEIGPVKIATKLKEKELSVSTRTIWVILKQHNLQTAAKRRENSYNFRHPRQAQDLTQPKHLRLIPDARKRMIEEVILGDSTVTQITKQYKISRKTFAKWKKRYLLARENDQNILEALIDAHPTGSAHPSGVDQNIVSQVLSIVIADPQLSSHKIAQKLPNIGNHGVQRILERAGLSKFQARMSYSSEHQPVVIPVLPPVVEEIPAKEVGVISYLPHAPPPAPTTSFKGFLFPVGVISPFVIIGLIFWVRMLFSYPLPQALGLFFATIALIVGTFFFLYSLKYYLTTALVLSFSQQTEHVEEQLEEERKGRGFVDWILGLSGRRKKRSGSSPVGLTPNLDHIKLDKYPMVSIQIPFYNEKNVAQRAITAAINLDYPEYEVIIADDSTDETPNLVRAFQSQYGKLETFTGDGFTLTSVQIKKGVTLKHLHRTSRSGFKGAALKLALQYVDPRVEFISVFDADFVPYPDSLTLFLKYFKLQNKMSEDYHNSNVAVVQGYQWHVLNKSENWITRGVRTEYAGSYVIERSGTELYGGLKMISGSVYMIRRKPLEETGWGSSITEDFELTLKLYERGYKVVYTPYIQAPAECVSTFKRLIRQRMRWAEGHSMNIKKMFKRLLFSEQLTRAEKLEFIYLAPYYLQACFFLVGTFAWLISEVVFKAKLPFWTSLWGWSLVITNLISLPLVNIVGLFMEESEQKDYTGIPSFIALSYLVVPFQAYAAIKGFLEQEEGTWFRTPKTGRITDSFLRGKFYRLISGIFTGKKAHVPAFKVELAPNQYLALSSANSRFDNFKLGRKKIAWVSKSVLAILLIISTTLLYFSKDIKIAYATGSWASPLKLSINENDGSGDWPASGNLMYNQTNYGTGGSLFRFMSTANTYIWYTNTWPTGSDDAVIPAGAYSVQLAKVGGAPGRNFINFGVQLLLSSSDGATLTQLLWATYNINTTANADNTLFDYPLGTLSATNITAASPNRLAFRIKGVASSKAGTNINWLINNSGATGGPVSKLVMPGNITIPEIPKALVMVVLLVILPVMPTLVSGRLRKPKRSIFEEFGLAWKDLIYKFTGLGEAVLDELPV